MNWDKKWKSFKTDKKLLNEKQEIDEISKKALGKISNYLEPGSSKAQTNKLSFNNIFGNKTRITIPFLDRYSKADPSTEIGQLINFFQKRGYDIDFATGIATKEIETQKGKATRQEKIGKVLGKAQSIIKKFWGLRAEIVDLNSRIDKIQYNINTRNSETPEEDAQYIKVQTKKRDDLEEQKFNLYEKEKIILMGTGLNSIASSDEVDKLVNFWNSKSEYYRKNPSAAYDRNSEKYTIIVSRHPVDVLRMSDTDALSSCHAEGNSYFHCAIAEARGEGLVSYIVENQSLISFLDPSYKASELKEEMPTEELNQKLQNFLEQDEIFKDSKRNVSGIVPISRLRLRKYKWEGNNKEIAVPEVRIYGKRVPGFEESVLNWTTKVQPEYGSIENEGLQLQDFERSGGEYQDTSDSTLLNKFFGAFEERKGVEAPFEPMENAPFAGEDLDIEDDEEDEYERMYQEYTLECNNIQARFVNHIQNETVEVTYDVDYDPGEYVSVRFSAIAEFVFNFEDIIMNERNLSFFINPRNDLEKKINEEIKDYVENNGFIAEDVTRIKDNIVYTSVKAKDFITNKNYDSLKGTIFKVKIFLAGVDETDPRSFQTFCNDVIDIDKKTKLIEDKITQIFVKYGLMSLEIVKDAPDFAWFQDAERENSFKHFDIDAYEDEVVIKQKQPFVISNVLDNHPEIHVPFLKHIRSREEHKNVYSNALRFAVRDFVLMNGEFDFENIPINTALEVALVEDRHYIDSRIEIEDTKVVAFLNSSLDFNKVKTNKEVEILKFCFSALEQNYDLIYKFWKKRIQELLKKDFNDLEEWRKQFEPSLPKDSKPQTQEPKKEPDVWEQINNIQKVIKETEPFQKDMKKKHPGWKMRLIGGGKNLDKSSPYKIKPSMKRGKSAPPSG